MEATFYPRKQKEGKILAFADVVVTEGITVRGFRIIDGDNGVFAAVPSRGYTVDGKSRFAKQVMFADPEHRESFLSELLDSFYRWQESQAKIEGDSVETGVGGRTEAEAPF